MENFCRSLKIHRWQFSEFHVKLTTPEWQTTEIHASAHALTHTHTSRGNLIQWTPCMAWELSPAGESAINRLWGGWETQGLNQLLDQQPHQSSTRDRRTHGSEETNMDGSNIKYQFFWYWYCIPYCVY